MIGRFRHKGLAGFYESGSKAGIVPEHAKRLRLILAALVNAREPKDMNLPGFRFHGLTGLRAGYWAVSVSGNWRVVFRFDGDDVIDVDYLDYH